jgi:hypothetical protein
MSKQNTRKPNQNKTASTKTYLNLEVFTHGEEDLFGGFKGGTRIDSCHHHSQSHRQVEGIERCLVFHDSLEKQMFNDSLAKENKRKQENSRRSLFLYVCMVYLVILEGEHSKVGLHACWLSNEIQQLSQFCLVAGFMENVQERHIVRLSTKELSQDSVNAGLQQEGIVDGDQPDLFVHH